MQAACGKLNILICMLLALLLISTGCKYFSKPEPSYVISLHELAKDDQAYSQLCRTVWNPQQTRSVRIHSYAFLNAKRFYQAEVMPSDGNNPCGIRLYFDRFGHHTLLQACAQKKGQPFAVLVDGFFIGLSDFPSQLDECSFLDLAPLWSPLEAKQIADSIPENYRLLND